MPHFIEFYKFFTVHLLPRLQTPIILSLPLGIFLISVVDKIIKKEELSADDIQVKADLLVYYVYFDKGNNPQTVTGGSELIGRFVNEIGSLNITPLGFSTNKLSNNQVGNLVIEFALP